MPAASHPQGERLTNPGTSVREGAGVPGEARILSLLQPWATLWLFGEKLVETRSWGTDFRGDVVIHASKGFDRHARIICDVEPFRTALRHIGIHPDRLPRGAVIGKVRLTGCLLMTASGAGFGFELDRDRNPLYTEKERDFGLYRPERYAWITAREGRRGLGDPIPFKGSLGLRHCPPDIFARLAPP